jgi:hypothetical protein
MFTMNFLVAIVAVMLVALATRLCSNAGNVGAGLVTLMSLGSTLTTIFIAYTGLETPRCYQQAQKLWGRDRARGPQEQSCSTRQGVASGWPGAHARGGCELYGHR